MQITNFVNLGRHEKKFVLCQQTFIAFYCKRNKLNAVPAQLTFFSPRTSLFCQLSLFRKWTFNFSAPGRMTFWLEWRHRTTVVYLGECTPIQLFNSLMRLVISLATRLSYYRVGHGKIPKLWEMHTFMEKCSAVFGKWLYYYVLV